MIYLEFDNMLAIACEVLGRVTPESSNETSNGRSVIGGYPQVRLVTPILQNSTSDGHFGTRWYWLKRAFGNWGTEGREFKSPQPDKQRPRSEHISDLGLPVDDC